MFVDVLSNEFVSVFHGSLLPRGVGVGEEDRSVESLRHPLVPCELSAVVGGYGQDVPLERLEQPDDSLCHVIRVLAVGQPLHEQEPRHALGDGHDEVLAVLYEIHLEVPKLLPAFHAFGPLVYGHPVGDVPHARPDASLAVLQPVAAVPVERPAVALVLPDEVVYPFHRDHIDAVGIAVSLDLLGRPLPPLHLLADEGLHVRVEFARLVRTLLRVVGEHLGHLGRIVAVGAAVPLQLLADRRLGHPYGTRYLRLRLFVFPHSINCVPLRLVKMLHLAFVLETANVAFFPLTPSSLAGLFVSPFITF